MNVKIIIQQLHVWPVAVLHLLLVVVTVDVIAVIILVKSWKGDGRLDVSTIGCLQHKAMACRSCDYADR